MQLYANLGLKGMAAVCLSIRPKKTYIQIFIHSSVCSSIHQSNHPSICPSVLLPDVFSFLSPFIILSKNWLKPSKTDWGMARNLGFPRNTLKVWVWDLFMKIGCASQKWSSSHPTPHFSYLVRKRNSNKNDWKVEVSIFKNENRDE